MPIYGKPQPSMCSLAGFVVPGDPAGELQQEEEMHKQ